MDETKRKAFEGALDLTKQLITLATGTLALSATFMKDILNLDKQAPIPNKGILLATWILMLLSIFCGLMGHGAIVGTLDGADLKPDERKSAFDFNIKLWAMSQSIIFYLGICFLVGYVFLTM